ncbi:hypothetical protein BSKO_03658 [Bryopsis sp. KO-2023]|nr:hypothetical protein BSKO_03658 [Bryopsis sp. KO-2023]
MDSTNAKPSSHARNTRMWKDLGASYAELSALQDVDILNAGCTQERQATAGKPSHGDPHGPGGFVMANTWSIGGGDPPTKLVSEQRSKYCAPPKQDNPKEKPQCVRGGNFSLGADKNDYRTVAQIDFKRDRSPSPPLPIRPKDAGGVYSMGDHVSFKTTAGSSFKDHCQEFVNLKANRGSGLENTHQPGYNIINGSGSLSNNAFESWDGRDYRRMRG